MRLQIICLGVYIHGLDVYPFLRYKLGGVHLIFVSTYTRVHEVFDLRRRVSSVPNIFEQKSPNTTFCQTSYAVKFHLKPSPDRFFFLRNVAQQRSSLKSQKVQTVHCSFIYVISWVRSGTVSRDGSGGKTILSWAGGRQESLMSASIFHFESSKNDVSNRRLSLGTKHNLTRRIYLVYLVYFITK